MPQPTQPACLNHWYCHGSLTPGACCDWLPGMWGGGGLSAQLVPARHNFSAPDRSCSRSVSGGGGETRHHLFKVATQPQPQPGPSILGTGLWQNLAWLSLNLVVPRDLQAGFRPRKEAFEVTAWMMPGLRKVLQVFMVRSLLSLQNSEAYSRR